jgi:hypothetical protein
MGSDVQSRIYQGETPLYVPIRVAGLPAEALIIADRTEVQLLDADGIVEKLNPAESFHVANDGPSAGERHIHQTIGVSGELYRRLKNRPVRLRIDYFLTLLRLASSHAIPALDGDQRTPALGWCGTKLDPSGSAVRLGCVLPGKPPACATAVLEHKPSGRRNPEQMDCVDYAPYFGQLGPDAMSRPLVEISFLAFRDPSGLARYPVDGPQLAESRVVLRTFEVRDHFVRHLEIPDIRLEELEAQENGR